MKYFSVIAMTTTISAQFRSIRSTEDGLEEGARKLPAIKGMLGELMGITDAEVAIRIKNYGCFCFIDNDKTAAHKYRQHAEPLDELDTLCKKLFKSERCLQTDHNDGAYTKSCDAYDGFTWHIDATSGEITCGNADPAKRLRDGDDDPNNCEMALCETEKAFAIEVEALLNSGTFTANPEYKSMGDLVYDGYCGAERGADKVGGDGEKDTKPIMSCCGDGLERQTFNGLFDECCADGSVRAIGSC